MDLTGCKQAVVERANGCIVQTGAHRGHVENLADITSAPANAAAPFPLTAVVVEGSEPDERRDLLSGQATEFGNEGVERAACDGAYASDGPEGLVPGFELRPCLDG